MYVVVQFYPWFNFYFPLFWGMVIYDNEFKTKGNKNKTKDKIEPQHVIHWEKIDVGHYWGLKGLTYSVGWLSMSFVGTDMI